MSERKGALSPLRRGIGLLVLISAIVLGAAVGVLLRSDRSVPAAPPPLATAWVVFAALGGVVALIGAAIYGIVLSTCCFTFDFTRPYTPRLSAKLWPANLVVQLLIVTGFTLVIAPPLITCFWGVLPGEIALLTGFFVPFVAIELVWMWLQIWAPLGGLMVRRRMRVLGVPADRIAAGVPVGVSAERPKLRKLFSMILEDDVGLLWFDADRLVYFGDRAPWSLTRDELLAVERDAHKMATSSYFGAVHVVLHYRTAAGEGRIRLHTQGDWNQSARRRALDELADRLTSWQSGGTPQPRAIGFAVVPQSTAPLPLPDAAPAPTVQSNSI